MKPRETPMPQNDPADKHEEEQPARSGEHRVQQGAASQGELPPTPDVLTKRTRIITGVYSIIRPRGPRPRSE